MAIKKATLNYVPAAPKKSPVDKIAVPSNHREALGRPIRQKVRQNVLPVWKLLEGIWFDRDIYELCVIA